MGIPVKLQVFEGPLDLLLYLIEKNKLIVYNYRKSHIKREVKNEWRSKHSRNDWQTSK